MERLGESTGEVRSPRGERWGIHYTWATVGGRAEVVEVRIRSLEDPPVPITTTALRSLNLGSSIDQKRSEWAEALTALAAGDDRWAEHANAMGADAAEGRRGGNPGTDDAELAEVARVYREALAAGQPTGHAIQDHFHLSASGAAKRIRRAREQGYPMPSPRAGNRRAES